MAARQFDALRFRSRSTWWLVVVAIVTSLYVADLLLRAFEIVLNQKLPHPEYFATNANVFFLLLLH
jgi:hypothetical protein